MNLRSSASRPLRTAGLTGLFLTTLACLTVNVYFPEAAIRDLSEQIEEEVQKGLESPAPNAPAAPPAEQAGIGGVRPPLQALYAALWQNVLATTPVHADEVPDPGVSNPAIRKIIESRRARVQAIRNFKSQGVLGENNRALLEARQLDALSDLQQRAEAQRLVKAENADREQLFREIAAAQNVDAGQVERIQTTYAETLRANAQPGDWIQMPDGAWRQK
jgi:uncharacterized protein